MNMSVLFYCVNERPCSGYKTGSFDMYLIYQRTLSASLKAHHSSFLIPNILSKFVQSEWWDKNRIFYKHIPETTKGTDSIAIEQ